MGSEKILERYPANSDNLTNPEKYAKGERPLRPKGKASGMLDLKMEGNV